MFSHTDILRPEFCTHYLYASTNALHRHFYISFAAHVEGTVRHRLSFWDWFLGKPSIEHVDEYLEVSYYKQRIHWFYANHKPVSIDEEVALHAIKAHFDKQAGQLGSFKFAESRQRKMARWPAKRVEAKLLYS